MDEPSLPVTKTPWIKPRIQEVVPLADTTGSTPTREALTSY